MKLALPPLYCISLSLASTQCNMETQKPQSTEHFTTKQKSSWTPIPTLRTSLPYIPTSLRKKKEKNRGKKVSVEPVLSLRRPLIQTVKSHPQFSRSCVGSQCCRVCFTTAGEQLEAASGGGQSCITFTSQSHSQPPRQPPTPPSQPSTLPSIAPAPAPRWCLTRFMLGGGKISKIFYQMSVSFRVDGQQYFWGEKVKLCYSALLEKYVLLNTPISPPKNRSKQTNKMLW